MSKSHEVRRLEHEVAAMERKMLAAQELLSGALHYMKENGYPIDSKLLIAHAYQAQQAAAPGGKGER